MEERRTDGRARAPGRHALPVYRHVHRHMHIRSTWQSARDRGHAYHSIAKFTTSLLALLIELLRTGWTEAVAKDTARARRLVYIYIVEVYPCKHPLIQGRIAAVKMSNSESDTRLVFVLSSSPFRLVISSSSSNLRHVTSYLSFNVSRFFILVTSKTCC